MTDAPLKVLLLTPQTPFPPDQGAAIRNYSFVRYLGSDPRYSLALLSFARPGGATDNSPARVELEKYCQKVVLLPAPPPRSKAQRLSRLFLTLQPDLSYRLADPAFERALGDLVVTFQPDVIQCEGLEMSAFVLHSLGRYSHLKLVLDEHNAEYLLQRRIFENDWQAGWRRRPAALYSWLQARRLRRYERRALQIFRVIAVSEADRQALLTLGPTRTPLTVIPNGLDLTEFGYQAEDATTLPDSLVFTGTMDFRPNVDAVTWFVERVWPLILARKPQARFVIVGRRPPPAVTALGRQPGVHVTGVVADARPFVRQSMVYVVPMRMGGGVRFKVLESLAMGRPVVTTSLGADGIPLIPGQHALIADTPAAFAEAVLDLLDDPARRTALARQGRAFVEQHFDWRTITPALDRVLLT